jgi:hypothetical protein
VSLADLYDTTIRVWRRTVTPGGGSLREELVTYVAQTLPPAPNACVNRPTAPIADKGPGYGPIGEQRVYMAAETDVEVRDVLELVAGPDAPRLLEVDEPPTRPRGHHVQLRTRLFEGDLETTGSS